MIVAFGGYEAMSGKAYDGWLTAGSDMWMLSAEAAMVMALRTARIAAGGAAGVAEAELMVTKEVRAAIERQTCLMTGGLCTTPLRATQGTLKHYRYKVAANKRRLR